MKRIIAFAFLILSFTQCTNSKDPLHYFSEAERDSLLADIITYVYVPAPNANNQTKFKADFRAFYVKQLPSFYLQNYVEKDGISYFFMIRPVGASALYRRGVLGKMQLDPKNHRIISFEEIANTPHLPEEVVRERGKFLFNKLVQEGNLDGYLAMKQYIEWPDASLKYDKKTHTWVNPQALSLLP